MQTLPVGDRHVLEVSSTPGGWELRVLELDAPLGSVVVTPSRMARLVRRGTTLTAEALEVRGLKWEIEFRLKGELLGRVRKDEFMAAVDQVSPGA